MIVVVRDEIREAYTPRCGERSARILPCGYGCRLVERLHGVEGHAEHGLHLLGLEPKGLRRGGVEEEKDVVELPVAATRYLLLDAAAAQRDELAGFDAQAQLLLYLPQAVEGLFPRRKMPGSGHVEVARPGVLSGRAALYEQVGAFGAGAGDPAVETPVPQSQSVRLALRGDLTGWPPGLVQDIQQLVHETKGSR